MWTSSPAPNSPTSSTYSNISRGDPDHLSIIQHNCARSNQVFLSLFSSFAKNSPPQIVAIQEPFLFNNIPLDAPGYTLVLPFPAPPPDRISVCFYILSDFLKSTSFFPLLFNRGDLIGVNLHWNNAPSSSNLKSLKILNAYNRHISPSE